MGKRDEHGGIVRVLEMGGVMHGVFMCVCVCVCTYTQATACGEMFCHEVR